MSNRTARTITGFMRSWRNSSRMLTTANNKTKRMIQERVPDNQASFLYKVFYKKFTKFYDNVQKYTIYQK